MNRKKGFDIMKCIIIDDDIVFSKKLYKKIDTYLNTLFHDYHIEIVTEQFDKPQYNQYDIIFLDIDLRNQNGIQLGKQINTSQFNNFIIFVSSLNECVFDALTIQPLFFVRKSHLDKDFQSLTHILNNVLKNRSKHFEVNINGRQNYIYNHEIQYISVAGHDITINTELQSYTFRGSLNELLKKINDPHIIQVSKTTAVNLQNIKSISHQTILLNKNTKVTIGRTYKDIVEQKYMELLLR